MEEDPKVDPEEGLEEDLELGEYQAVEDARMWRQELLAVVLT